MRIDTEVLIFFLTVTYEIRRNDVVASTARMIMIQVEQVVDLDHSDTGSLGVR